MTGQTRETVGEALTRQLADRGYAEVGFPVGWAGLAALAADFLRFLDRPDAEKRSWSRSYRISATARESQVGYIRRDRPGDDDKEFFHYNAVFEELFAERLAAAELDEATGALLASCRRLHRSALSCLVSAWEQLEPVVPGLRERFVRPGTQPRLTLRFVSYHPRASDELLAQGHYDRSAWTLAIAESAPGLRIGRTPDQLREVEYREDRALFFPGRQQSDFPPIWHEVANVSGAERGRPAVRWAIVAFANELDRRVVASVEETNTPVAG